MDDRKSKNFDAKVAKRARFREREMFTQVDYSGSRVDGMGVLH